MPGDLLPTVRILLQWTLPPGGGIRAVRIFRWEGVGPEPDTIGLWTHVGEFTGDRATIEGVIPSLEYRFRAAPVFADGSIPTEEHWEEVKVTPAAHDLAPPLPATPTNFGVSQDGAILHFAWDPSEDDATVAWEIRMGSGWPDGILVGRAPHPWWKWPWYGSGAKTFHVKAVDALGRYSAAAAEATVTIRDLEDYVLTNTMDESGGGFTGTKSGVEVNGGNLELADVGSPANSGTQIASASLWYGWSRYKNEGTYTTAVQDLGALAPHRLEMDLGMSVQTAAGLVAADGVGVPLGLRSDGAGNAVAINRRRYGLRNFGDHARVGHPEFLIEIDTTPDAGGSPVWDGYRRYVPGVYYCRQVRFRVTLYGDGLHYLRISTLKFYHRKRNMKDEVSSSVTGSPGPTAISFVAPFTAAPVVVATVLDAAGSEFVALASNISTSGCDVRVYDATGAEVFTGTVHVIAAGV